jgi:bifunctional non-homologous end joining protein LigD
MPEDLELNGHKVAVSNRGKVLFPCGITKGDLIDYYVRIAPQLLPHCRHRALTMQRFPDGIGKPGFFQKHMPDYFPAWIARTEMAKQDGTVVHVVADNAATLAYLANQGCITPHLALATIEAPHCPDRIVLDLDPSDDDFAKVQECAAALKKRLDGIGLAAFVQTTGSRGLHIVIPIHPERDFDTVRQWLRGFVAGSVETTPALMTLEMSKAKRGKRVFVDTLRNAYGQTSVAPYAVRARDEAPVATPLRWSEALSSDMSAGKYTIKSIFRRLAQVQDPWADLFTAANALPI